MPLYPPRSAGGMWQPPAVFTAATWRRGRSHTMRAPLLSVPADVNAPAQPPARCERIHAPQTGFTLPPTGFAPPPRCRCSVHNVASGPLEEALAASISPMSNRGFTWTSGLPPEAYLLGLYIIPEELTGVLAASNRSVINTPPTSGLPSEADLLAPEELTEVKDTI
ncbi:hypothetical protein B0H13DRAFT_2266934 [Mycena leptocephala]|nr:hypothetical protein B0H13DRAFT_2266934 [Mycena leptocephala]